jgi:hypothetical protein
VKDEKLHHEKFISSNGTLMQVFTEKSSIAWFKLAELVARKEKERALYMFRLLSHSLSEKALVTQLEADILLAFGDERALSVYLQAASLFEQNEDVVMAKAIYEHVAYLQASCDLRLQKDNTSESMQFKSLGQKSDTPHTYSFAPLRQDERMSIYKSETTEVFPE